MNLLTKEQAISFADTFFDYARCDSGVSMKALYSAISDYQEIAKEFGYDADDYFMSREYMERPYSQYDCTGKLFTSWYHLFQRHGEYYAYHSVSLDV